MSADLPGIAFLDAEDCCKWPVFGDGLDLRVCGGNVAKGKSYCAPHHMLAYVPWEEAAMQAAPFSRFAREGAERSEADEGLATG